MTSLVIHTALDWLRKNRRLVPTEHEVLDIIPAHEPDLTPEEQMDLYRLLDSLPTEERTYLILHYFEERSFPRWQKSCPCRKQSSNPVFTAFCTACVHT